MTATQTRQSGATKAQLKTRAQWMRDAQRCTECRRKVGDHSTDELFACGRAKHLRVAVRP